MNKRQESREQAFIIVFEKQFNSDATVDELCDAALEAELFEADSFAKALAERTIASADEIDDTICRYLASGWKIARLSKVVLSILRLAVCEMKYFDSVPCAVSINEAVELAKKYASEPDPSFVNALLGSVIKNIDEPEKSEPTTDDSDTSESDPSTIDSDVFQTENAAE